MSGTNFYTNFLYSLESFSLPPIAGEKTKVSQDVASAYVYEVANAEDFNSISLVNNDILESFYDSIILKSNTLDSTSNFNKNFINSIYQIDPSQGALFIDTKFQNPSYKAKRPDQVAKVEIQTDGLLNNKNLQPDFKLYTRGNQTFDKITFGSKNSETVFTNQNLANPYTEVREYSGIYLLKYDIRLEPFWKEIFPWGSIDKNSDLYSKICSEFQKCKLYTFVVKNYDFSNSTFYYSTYLFLILDVSSTRKEVQDFTSLTGIFSGSETLQLSKTFFPFSVVKDNSTVYVGDFGSGNISGLIPNYPEFKKNVSGLLNDDRSITGFSYATMACDLGGNLMISYTGTTGYQTGTVFKVPDSQLCGATGTTVFIRVNDVISSYESFYKDLPNVNNALDIYAYNYSGIDYVKNDGTISNIINTGSIVDYTEKYSNQTLDTSKYYSYDYAQSLKENGFTFSYNFRAKNDIHETQYILDFKPKIKKPTLSLYYNKENDEVIVTSNYATNLLYKFNDGSYTTVAITDTSDGLNQKTTISTANQIGSIFIEVRNYFYDFTSENLEVFSAKKNLDLAKNITISNFTFQLKRASSTATFYDADGSALTSITGTDFGQGDIFSYFYYPLNSNTDTYRIYLTYGGETLYVKLSKEFTPEKIISGSYYEIAKSKLEKFIKKDGSLDIIILKGKKIEYTFPFNIKTIYATTPTSTLPSVTNVVMKSASFADVSFSFTHSYATEAICEIFNQNNALIASRKIDLNYSSSATIESNQIKGVNVTFSAGLYVKVTTRSLDAVSGVESFKTATSSSSSYILPLRLSITNPAEIKFYSDSGLTTEVSSISKDTTIYVKLLLNDLLNNQISTSQYVNYIKINQTTPILKINNKTDANVDFRGVTFTRLNYYSYSLFISSDSSVSGNELSISANFDPTF